MRSSGSRTAAAHRQARRSRRSTRGRTPRRFHGYRKWRRQTSVSTTESRYEAGRVLQGLPRLALGEGARHLDEGARAARRPRARRARVGHVLRRRRHPRGGAGLLRPPQRADPRVRRGDRLRHAHDGLQRLHAQPPPGEPHAPGRREPPRPRQREPQDGRRAAVLRQGRSAASPLGDRGRPGLRASPAGRAQGAEGPEGRAVLRLPDPAPVEDHGLRGSRPSVVARADHHRVRRRARRLSRRRSSAAASRSSRRARRRRWASSSSRSRRRWRPAPT